MSFIGVLHPSMISVDVLKKHLLYFDKFHVPGLKMYRWSLSGNPSDENDFQLSNLDYLEKINAIKSIDIPIDEIDKILLNANVLSNSQQYEYDSYAFTKLQSPYLHIGAIDRDNIDLNECSFREANRQIFKGEMSPSIHPLLSDDFSTVESDILARAYAVNLNSKGIPATPILRKLDYTENITADRSSVVSIVIRKLPTLNQSIPFDEVFSFKNENSHLRLELRNWINDIASGKFSTRYIEEKLEYLLHIYSDETRLHDRNSSFTIFETVVKVPLEIAESVIRFKFSSAVTSLFSIRHKKIKLLQQEAKLEGREVGYIHHAYCNFQSDI